LTNKPGRDGAGNIENDGNNRYVYDLDGHICAAENLLTTAATQYVYDAEGRRVAKGSLSIWPAAGSACAAPTAANGFTLTATYLRGAAGTQDAELDWSAGTETSWHQNVYADGGLLATYTAQGTAAPALYFSFNDWLGTKRLEIVGNGATAGQMVSWWSSDPFGNYLATYGAGTDATEQHFTGKERDGESGNDYFGARYYASSMGRFISPDWSAKYEPVPYAKLDNPQTLNLYAYVGNNPLNRTDPTGHYEIGCGSGVKNCDKQMQNTNDAIAKGLKSKDPSVVAAAKAYGKLGEKNGVNVSVVNVVDAKNSNVTGNTSGSLQVATDGVNAVMQNTQVNIQAGLSSNDLSDTVVHEGSHVEDHANYAAAVNALQDMSGQLPKAMNVTARQSEVTAYGVENANRAQRGAASIDINGTLAKPPYSTNPNINQGIFDAPY